MSVGNLSPGEVAVTLTGVGINLTLEGFMDGTFISAERTEDAFSYQGGSDGNGTRILNSDKSGTITLSLLQSANHNKDLSERLILDEASGEGAFAINVRDSFGSDIISSLVAWVQQTPVAAWSKDGDEGREWVIACGNLQMKLGGNTQL